MLTSTRTDVRRLAAEIEALAKRVQSEIDNSGNFLLSANELVRNSTTMVFALGEVYAAEKLLANKHSANTNSNTPSKTNRVYFRDSRGRFARKPQRTL